MKPVKKDGRRQARRKRTLERLEAHLAGGVRTIKVEQEELNMGVIPGKRLVKKFVEQTVPFEQKDIDRINGEITTLKQRLGTY